MPAAAQARARFGFDGKNKSAQAVAKKRAASLVTEVTASTRQAIRNVIVRSIRDGVPPYDAARAIRSIVGLTSQQANAVMNYREQLIDLGHTLERVNRLVDEYAERQLRRRALTIARTEIQTALHDGSLEAWSQAQDEGLLSQTATKEIIVTDDEKLCPICEAVDGQVRPLDQPFHTDAGDVMMPPLHVSCRCDAAVNP